MIALLLLGWGAGVSVAAQAVQSPIHVSVTTVPVDVIVVDKDGEPVSGLGPRDFEIFEDGKRQRIIYWDWIDFTADKPGNPRKAHGLLGEAESILDPTPQQRSFLFVFGRGVNTEFRAISRLIAFVEERLTPRDQVAVLAYNRATPFTTDHRAIIEILKKYEDANPEIDRLLNLEGRYFRPKGASDSMSKGVQSRIDEIFSSERLGAKAVLQSRTAPGMLGQEEASLWAAGNRSETEGFLRRELESGDALAENQSTFTESGGRLPITYPPSLFGEYVQRSLRSGWDVSNLFSALETLRFLPGEKHLVFFSQEGLFLPEMSREGEEIIGRMACDSRVRIDCVQTGGTVEAPPIHFELGADRTHFDEANDEWLRKLSFRREAATFAQRALVNISTLSGGKGSLMTDPYDALRSVERMSRSAYLLAYRPRLDEPDGAFHTIEVRVKRRDVRVYHRQGYYTTSRSEPSYLERDRGYSRIVAVAGFPQDVQDLALTLEITELKQERREIELRADVRLYFGREMVRNEDNRYRVRMPFTAFFLDREHRLVSQSWDSIDLNLSDTTLQNLVKNGLTFSHRYRVPRAARDGWTKIIVYDPLNDRVASVSRRVKEPPPD